MSDPINEYLELRKRQRELVEEIRKENPDLSDRLDADIEEFDKAVEKMIDEITRGDD